MAGNTSGSQRAPPPPSTGWAAYGVTVAPATPPPRVRGGVLIFFPSYAVMENVCARWKETGVYDKLRGAVGSVLMEPKGAGISTVGGNSGNTSGDVRQKTYSSHSNYRSSEPVSEPSFMMSGVTRKAKTVGEEEEEGSEEFRTIVGQFEHAIKTYGGCVLLAVCRYHYIT